MGDVTCQGVLVPRDSTQVAVKHFCLLTQSRLRICDIAVEDSYEHLPPECVITHARRLALHPTPQQSRPRGSQQVRAQWLENSAEVDVAAPLDRCWQLWEDQERIPRWMPWIHEVKVSPEDTRMSRWTLRTEQFGRNWEFSWVARLLTPIKHQKIHWRSVPGSTGGSLGSGLEVANQGQIRFYPRGKGNCAVKLTISYEVPDVLAPLGGALTPVVENILRTDMRRFAQYAASEVSGAS